MTETPPAPPEPTGGAAPPPQQATAEPAATPPKAMSRQRPAEDDGPQVIGGRLIWGVVFLIGIGVVSQQPLNAWIDRQLNPPKLKPAAVWEIGKEARLELTLI